MQARPLATQDILSIPASDILGGLFPTLPAAGQAKAVVR